MIYVYHLIILVLDAKKTQDVYVHDTKLSIPWETTNYH